MLAVSMLAEYFRKDDVHALVTEWGDVDETELEAIATSLESLRAYGVKPCVINDGLLHPPDHAWVFTDGHELVGGLDPGNLHGMCHPLAVTHLAKRKSIKRIKPQMGRIEGDLASVEVSFGFERQMSASIQPDGSFTVDIEMGIIPVKKMFDDASLSSIYPLFRLIHLLRLYDLIVPVEVVRAMPAWPSLPANSLERTTYLARAPKLWRTLVVPRLRVLRDPTALQEAMNREIMQSKELTRRLAERNPHDVIGFLRPLPAGHQASPEARMLAWEEHRIAEIPDGYTYVRDHKRGKGDNKTIGHVAQRRSNS